MSSASLGDKSPGVLPTGPRGRVGKYEVINAEASLLEGMASKEVISGFIGLERVLVGLGAFTSPHPLLSLNQ